MEMQGVESYTQLISYQYITSQQSYYRLKQIDWNGSFQYSRIVVLDFLADRKYLVLYPNPVTGGVVTIDLPEGGTLEVKIYNASGMQVKAFKQTSRVLDVKGLSSGNTFSKQQQRMGGFIKSLS
ncbi:Por secretion system C-terminal sorting domain-containing protein [Dyadobacter soli]|uniref:Por secretion system C-terminal sorting domain-containing protein n=1 Tax=Dyadobacter soli TaxID=659014 RepID=A0A1G8D5L1_9BACT|nr:T9SS type A sorting domain-containing protein [Dyadobacter soli]SDH52520.1 Por secretion system C-terminal sorting domain-containing protein [Dyadobacter soli]